MSKAPKRGGHRGAPASNARTTATGRTTAAGRTTANGRTTAPGQDEAPAKGPMGRTDAGRRGRAVLDLSAHKPRSLLLSACLIVKDEEKTLPGCVASLHRLVDEVVVYDTGSSDGTVELARRAGAKVIEGYWDDDFGRARNACLEHCRGEWVLWIDADERFVCPDPRELRGALEPLQEYDALLVEIRNLMGDGSQMGNIHRAFRIFRNSTCCWYGALHEQVDLRPGQPGRVRAVPLEGAHISHLGYMDEIVRERDKLERNLRLARAVLATGEVKEEQEGVAELNLGRALGALGRYEEAQPYLDEAVAKTLQGAPRRAALLYATHNLGALGRHHEAAEKARTLAEASTRKGLAWYLEGANLRRIGQPGRAVELLEQIGQCQDDDGFALPDAMVRAELAGALLEAGRAGEAADQMVLLIQQNPDVVHLTAALKVFALTGKSIASLVAAMPEDRLDKVAAALVMVPPVIGDQMAEALWARFGPRPQLLAAAIHFAPLLPVPRALDWSARLRGIGMGGACPLLAQAQMDLLDPVERARAAVTAHAAFGDSVAAELAAAIMPGIPEAKLGAVLSEASLLDPVLVNDMAMAARGPGAEEVDGSGTAAGRCQAVDAALARLGYRPEAPALQA